MPEQEAKPAHEIYVDRIDVTEIYADSLHNVAFQDPTLRIEFCVKRFDQALGGGEPHIKKVTTCRLALPIATVIELSSKLQQAIQALTAQGVLRIAQQESDQAH